MIGLGLHRGLTGDLSRGGPPYARLLCQAGAQRISGRLWQVSAEAARSYLRRMENAAYLIDSRAQLDEGGRRTQRLAADEFHQPISSGHDREDGSAFLQCDRARRTGRAARARIAKCADQADTLSITGGTIHRFQRPEYPAAKSGRCLF